MAAPRLLLELGRGGMGVVYLALSTDACAREELVVVKRLKADFAADPDFREMLLHEARILSRLAHPNVVRTLEAGFDGRHYYMTMEWLDGQPLNALLRDPSQALPLRLAVHALCQMLEGLHAAHELRGDPSSARSS